MTKRGNVAVKCIPPLRSVVRLWLNAYTILYTHILYMYTVCIFVYVQYVCLCECVSYIYTVHTHTTTVLCSLNVLPNHTA